MPKLTYFIAIDLPEDPFENAEVITKARPLRGKIDELLASNGFKNTVDVSLDGRKVPKANVPTVPDAPIEQAGTPPPLHFVHRSGLNK
jgi:hypothetical protein